MKPTPGNSEADRDKRRFAATCQALRDAITGVEHFESRTRNEGARAWGADVIAQVIGELGVLQHKLESKQAKES